MFSGEVVSIRRSASSSKLLNGFRLNLVCGIGWSKTKWKCLSYLWLWSIIDPRSKNEWNCTFTPPIRLHGVVLSKKKKHRANFTFNYLSSSLLLQCSDPQNCAFKGKDDIKLKAEILVYRLIDIINAYLEKVIYIYIYIYIYMKSLNSPSTYCSKWR
jgi:hypothetical protein